MPAGALTRPAPPGSTGNDANGAKRSVVIEGAKGQEIGQALTAMLRPLGVCMRYLVSGVQDWQAQAGRPSRWRSRQPPVDGDSG